MADIKNPSAYYAARDARIKDNATITRERNWLAADAGNIELRDWLMGSGEFAATLTEKTDTETGETFTDWVAHPLTEGMFANGFGDFMLSMRDSLLEWGRLTPGQTAAVRKALDRKREWVAQAGVRVAQRQARDASSAHVGTVGKRRAFTLAVGKILEYETQYGMLYIHLCRDLDDNVVVYKGSKLLGFDLDVEYGTQFESAEGHTITMQAMVKSHDTRDGVNQTVINRPTKVAVDEIESAIREDDPSRDVE